MKKSLTNLFAIYLLGVLLTVFAQSAAAERQNAPVPMEADAPAVLRVSNANGLLYLGKGERQPLVVGLGGAEGGNAWSGTGWKKVRDRFVDKGYAFLALAYFGGPGTPGELDRIALEDVYGVIAAAAKNPRVDRARIGIVGGSMGAQLALVLASHYPEITCVVALVPSHVVFTNHRPPFVHSCWTYQGRELPFVPINEEAVRLMGLEDYRAAHEVVLKDLAAVENAQIPVEKINGPILLVSARKDEMWPSTEMSDQIMGRLQAKEYRFSHQHVVVEGGHGDSRKAFDQVFAFLDTNFPAGR